MNYEEAVKFYQSPKFSKILGNESLIKLLDYLKNPQKKLSFIHIAGTNGKGSVCQMLSSVLVKSGLKVGLYTSPFIEVFNERIKINNENIKDDELVLCAEKIKDASEKLNLDLSAFAKITASAFLYFAKMNCDTVILETGLGGRLDATNVILPKISVITKIGLDHTEYLGDTIEKIAREKCGIIKKGVPVVTTKFQYDEAFCEIKNSAKENGSPLYIADNYSKSELGLKGEYQKQNAGIAVSVLELLNIDDDTIKAGLKSAFWPARFEFLTKNLLIDGAHNPDGINALLSSLKELKRPVHFVIAMMSDKNYKEAARLVNDFSKNVTVTMTDMPRCLSASELAKEFQNPIICKNPVKAVADALNGIQDDELVCALGSLYFVGEIRKNFKC